MGSNAKNRPGGALLAGHFYSSESEDDLDLDLISLEYSKARSSIIDKNLQ